MILQSYQQFIASKRKPVECIGFDVDPSALNVNLFDWQRRVVVWALKRGRAALFEEPGLGKTLQQLSWAEQVFYHTGMPVVVHSPVGVRHQTKREAEKFGIACPVAVVNDASEVIAGINVVNYEKIHLFDGVQWGGVVLDESGILKGQSGKTKQQIIDRYHGVRYRLACTATPAPNDHMELGNHAEFLGVCQSVDMLNRYFYHDSGDTSRWVLMGHARQEFWRWVSQWAVCIAKPSEIGGDDTGYELPELRVQRHLVEIDEQDAPDGFLFNTSGISATTLHEEKRMTNTARCTKAAELANATDGPVIVWCDTNYEADLLRKLIPDAVEVRGAMKDEQKEELLFGFAQGKYRVLISKPVISGHGCNWQHCNTEIFAGLSYSFELFYQSVRRCWRFGQTQPVDVHIILAESEGAIHSAIARKEADFAAMRSGMSEAMRESTLEEFGLREGKTEYKSAGAFPVPHFLG